VRCGWWVAATKITVPVNSHFVCARSVRQMNLKLIPRIL
jgi:hypothetical protein